MKHLEDMRRPWATLIENTKDLPNIMAVTGRLGGTRPAWCLKDSKKEHMLLAWPKESLLRSAMIVSGPVDKELAPCTTFPFGEGIANVLRVEKTHTWKNGIEGNVGCAIGNTTDVLWFYDPLYFRDRIVDLTEGVEQTFLMSAICFGVRPALIDDLTITNGPEYEAHAAKWLEENPGKKRIDVPALKASLKGRAILSPTPYACEYQARATVRESASFNFGPEQDAVKIHNFVVTFGSEQSLHVMMYASEKVCENGYEPKVGDDVDLLFWLQGRIVDIEEEQAEAQAQ